MSFPQFTAPHLIQHRLDRAGKLPGYVFLFSGGSPDEAFIINGEAELGRSFDKRRRKNRNVDFAQIIIERDGDTKRATIKDLSLDEVAKNTFNYYSSTIGGETVEKSNKEIFIDLAKKIFPNVRKYYMI